MKKVTKKQRPIAEPSDTEDETFDEPSENEEELCGEQSDNEEERSDAQSDNEADQMETESVELSKKRPRVTPLVKGKKNKAGIIYISSIPKHMNVTLLRGLLEPYGEVGRIYLEPERKGHEVRKKTASGKLAMINYTEGWVEFTHKRVAKAIVPLLNTKPISTNRKSVFCDIMWTMKYLPRFKWINLSERLAYERAVAREKMRTEIQQTRAEAAVFENAMSASAAYKARSRAKAKTTKQKSD